EDRSLTLHDGAALEDLLPGLNWPEIVQFPHDGTNLFGAIYYPPTQTSPPPVVVFVYGGPHAQMVRHAWDLTADLRPQSLASLGFAVFKLDNRGSARRGLSFEGAIKDRLGNIEVEDQAAGVRWLADQGLIDP